MTDHELDDLLRTLAISDDRVARLDLGGAEADLRADIIEGSAVEPAASRGSHRPAGGRVGAGGPARRLWVAGAAAAVIAVLVLVVQPFDRGASTAWADALVEAAENGPLLLIEGWPVVRADIYGTTAEGEMAFAADDLGAVDLHWRDPDGFDGWVEDRADAADHRETVTVLGHEATLLRYAGSDDHTTLFHDGSWTIEVRGRFDSIEAYKAVLARLRVVDVDTWLSAMPASVIAASDRAVVVRQMLAGLPLPVGFDAGSLEEGPLRERYHLGAEVAGGVACAWLAQWVDAVAAGDATSAQEAVDALQTTDGWPVLEEMERTGAYPEVVREYARAVATDGLVPGGTTTTVAESYRQGLGCGQEG